MRWTVLQAASLLLFSPALLRALCHCAAHPPRPCVHSYVARLLARCGYTVIIPARPNFEEDAEGAATAIARETPGADVVIPATKLDLTSLASCREVRPLLIGTLAAPASAARSDVLT